MSHWFYLMDSAQIVRNSPIDQLLDQWLQQGRAIDLYAQQPQALHRLGPVLCEPDATQIQQLHQAMGNDPAAWSFFISTITPAPGQTLQSCAAHWQQHALTIRTTDGLAYYLRFADTRVFAVLPQVMNAQQWATFCRCWVQWSHMDRHGQLQYIHADRVAGQPGGSPLWSESQYAQLIDITWPDALLHELEKIRPDWRRRYTLAQQHAIASEVQQQAQAQGKSEDIGWQIQACLQHPEVHA